MKSVKSPKAARSPRAAKNLTPSKSPRRSPRIALQKVDLNKEPRRSSLCPAKISNEDWDIESPLAKRLRPSNKRVSFGGAHIQYFKKDNATPSSVASSANRSDELNDFESLVDFGENFGTDENGASRVEQAHADDTTCNMVDRLKSLIDDENTGHSHVSQASAPSTVGGNTTEIIKAGGTADILNKWKGLTEGDDTIVVPAGEDKTAHILQNCRALLTAANEADGETGQEQQEEPAKVEAEVAATEEANTPCKEDSSEDADESSPEGPSSIEDNTMDLVAALRKAADDDDTNAVLGAVGAVAMAGREDSSNTADVLAMIKSSLGDSPADEQTKELAEIKEFFEDDDVIEERPTNRASRRKSIKHTAKEQSEPADAKMEEAPVDLVEKALEVNTPIRMEGGRLFNTPKSSAKKMLAQVTPVVKQLVMENDKTAHLTMDINALLAKAGATIEDEDATANSMDMTNNLRRLLQSAEKKPLSPREDTQDHTTTLKDLMARTTPGRSALMDKEDNTATSLDMTNTLKRLLVSTQDGAQDADADRTQDITANLKQLIQRIQSPSASKVADDKAEDTSYTINNDMTISLKQLLARSKEPTEDEQSESPAKESLNMAAPSPAPSQAPSTHPMDIDDDVHASPAVAPSPSPEPMMISHTPIKEVAADDEVTLQIGSAKKQQENRPKFVNAEDMPPLSMDEFLDIIGVRFLADVTNNRRKTSVGGLMPSQDEAMEMTLKDKFNTAFVDMVEYDKYDWSCEQLESIANNMVHIISTMEEECAQNPPSIFSDVQNVDETERQDIGQKLKNFQKFCKLQARREWYQWRVKLHNAIQSEFMGKQDDAEEDVKRVSDFLSELAGVEGKLNSERNRLSNQPNDRVGSLLGEIAEQGEVVKMYNDQLVSLRTRHTELSQRSQMLVSTKEALQQKINAAAQQAAPRSSEISRGQVAELEDAHDIISGCVGWRPAKLNQNEIVLHFNDMFVVTFSMGNGAVNDSSFEMLPTGQNIDPFYQALVEAADIPTVLAEAFTPAQIPEALDDVSLRLGRIDDICKELRAIEHSHVVQYSKGDGCGRASIEFMSPSTRSKFIVAFDLSAFRFSSAPIWSFTSVYGKVTKQAISSIVDQHASRPYNRLTKIVAGIDALCNSA